MWKQVLFTRLLFSMMAFFLRVFLFICSIGILIPGIAAQQLKHNSGRAAAQQPPILATEAASRFVGGPDFQPVGIEVDANGNIYVAGNNVPLDPTNNFIGAELYKLNPQFEQVLWLPLGAFVMAMTMDPSGNLYLTGITSYNTAFPILNPVQGQSNGAQDVFLTKVDPDGNLLFSTYLGGSSVDTVDVLTVDADGNAFLAGSTQSADFPITPNAYISEFQPSQSSRELYVAKIATGSATLEYSTGFATGTPFDRFEGIAEVSGGDVYLLLSQSPTDFPVTDGSTNTDSKGQLFARLSADGSALVFATYSETDFPHYLILDTNGDPVLAGADSFTTIDPATNMVISKVQAFIGYHVRMSKNGNLVGIGSGGPVQATGGGFASSGGDFVAEVSGDGSPVFTSSMPMGTAARDVAFGPNGGIYVLGSSGLVSRILPDQTDPLMALPRILGIANAAGPAVTSKIAPGEIVSLYGPSIGSQDAMTTQIGSDGLVTTALGGVEVHFNGTKGRLLYTGPTQVNAVAPFAWSQGDTVLVEVFHDGNLWSSQMLNPVDAEPGVFSYQDSAAALNQDQTINDFNHPAPPGSVVAIFVTGAGAMMGGAYQDGEVFDPSTPVADLPAPKLPVYVTGTPSPVTAESMARNPPQEILYAGQAPASLAGVIQVNFRLPEPPSTSDHFEVVLFLSVGSGSGVRFKIWMTSAEGQ